MYNKIIVADGEEIKDIKGFEGLYAVTSHGRVWSYPKGKGSSHKGDWLSPYLVRGYPTVEIGVRRENRITAVVHRLVGYAFIENESNKPCINHIDGVKTNNTVSNLEWCTYAENNLHAYKMGLKSQKGVPRNFSINHIEYLKTKQIEKNKSRRKLTVDQASEVCEIYATGMFTYTDIGIGYEVSRKVISGIVKGESYVA